MKVHELVAAFAKAAEAGDAMTAVREVLDGMTAKVAAIEQSLAYIKGIGGNAQQVFYRSPQLTLLKVLFPNGRRTPPHDHGTWATILLLSGEEKNTLYRVEDGRLRKATGGKGVDVVFDSIGKTTLRDSFRATRTRGLVVNYGNVSGSVTDLDPLELGESGSLLLTRPRLADHLRDADEIRRRADDVFGALMDGSLRIDIAGRYTLDNVHEAHAAYEARQMVGKPVLDIGS